MPESRGDPSLLQRLKERKFVQWAVAYLAGAWVLFEVSDAVGGRLGWPDTLYHALLVILAIGFFITLVLAWYHGEKGRQRVSGPELLMLAALLVIAGGVLSTVREEEAGSGTTVTAPPSVVEDDRPSVAVLPCDNLSADPADEFLAPALHDEILLKLQGISSLFSIGRASVEWYRDHPVPLTQVAQELGVGFVGECSVQKYEEQIRLIFQLLDGRTGGQVWADDYDRDLTVGNLFSIQGDIAQQVARAIGAVLTPADQARINERPTENLDAFNAYSMGRFLQEKRTPEGLRRAISFFEQAIARDTAFAQALSALADSHFLLSGYGYEPPSTAFPVGKAAAQRAVELNPLSGEAYTSLGFAAYMFDWDWEAAELNFQRAVELSPDYARAHQWYSKFLRDVGRLDESLIHARRAHAMEPLSPAVNQTLSLILMAAGKTDEAMKLLLEMVALDPDLPVRHRDLGVVYLSQGSNEKAVQEFEIAESLASEGTIYEAWLGFGYGLVGDSALAFSILQDLLQRSETDFVPSGHVASVYLGLGDKDLAFEWLVRAFDERSDYLLDIRNKPVFDGVRDDPRYHDLVGRMNFPS